MAARPEERQAWSRADLDGDRGGARGAQGGGPPHRRVRHRVADLSGLGGWRAAQEQDRERGADEAPADGHFRARRERAQPAPEQASLPPRRSRARPTTSAPTISTTPTSERTPPPSIVCQSSALPSRSIHAWTYLCGGLLKGSVTTPWTSTVRPESSSKICRYAHS